MRLFRIFYYEWHNILYMLCWWNFLKSNCDDNISYSVSEYLRSPHAQFTLPPRALKYLCLARDLVVKYEGTLPLRTTDV